MFKLFLAVISNKTTMTAATTLGGLGIWILSLLKIVSIVFGAVGAVVAFTVSVIAFRQNYHKWKKSHCGRGFIFYLFRS